MYEFQLPYIIFRILSWLERPGLTGRMCRSATVDLMCVCMHQVRYLVPGTIGSELSLNSDYGSSRLAGERRQNKADRR